MRMIQPINTLTPRVGFRGKHEAYSKAKGLTNSQVAFANAAGVATVAGGLTTLVARAYTNSFAHAGVLGVFGAFLTMFFMTPHLIEKFGITKFAQKAKGETAVKQDLSKTASNLAKEYAIPVRKLVQFRSDKAPTS